MRVGVVGCGRIARNHVDALRAVPGVEVTGVADVDRARADEFAARHRVARAFTDVDDLLSSGLDAVTICTPHGAHEAGVLAAARQRVHVLCEKPIALRVAQAARMVAATAAADVRFGVLYQRRFWPAAQRIRTAIDEGRLGSPITGGILARLNRDAAYYAAEPWRGRQATEGGGVLLTQVIHHIDLLQWFMGPAVRVTGRCDTLVHREIIEVEDTAAAIVEFDSGGIATIQAGTTFRPGLGVQVWVGDAQGRTMGLSEYPEGVGFSDVSTVDGDRLLVAGAAGATLGDLPLAEIHDQLAPYHAMQIADFVGAVRDGREPAVTGRDAVRSLSIVEAIYRSSAAGAPVPVATR